MGWLKWFGYVCNVLTLVWFCFNWCFSRWVCYCLFFRLLFCVWVFVWVALGLGGSPFTLLFASLFVYYLICIVTLVFITLLYVMILVVKVLFSWLVCWYLVFIFMVFWIGLLLVVCADCCGTDWRCLFWFSYWVWFVDCLVLLIFCWLRLMIRATVYLWVLFIVWLTWLTWDGLAVCETLLQLVVNAMLYFGWLLRLGGVTGCCCVLVWRVVVSYLLLRCYVVLVLPVSWGFVLVVSC